MPASRRSTPTPAARARFLDAGLAILGERGHAGLKLAAVCARAGTTTGSFYHAFPKWARYTSDLIAYWREEQSQRLISNAMTVTDPRERLDHLIDIGLHLDPDSESAIRVWAAHDPEVLAHLTEVDAIRHAAIRDTYLQVGGDAALADEYARIAMYLLVGYQSGTQRSPEALAIGFRRLMEAILATESLNPPTPPRP